jgi:predicted nucleotidyltransferase component of viral defense system
MDKTQPIDLSSEEIEHAKFMKAIVQSMTGTPYILKGGTALMFGYGLDRFSEDLDFDSTKRINMESRIKNILPHNFKNVIIEVTKLTETVQRYRVSYDSPAGRGKLKHPLEKKQ